MPCGLLAVVHVTVQLLVWLLGAMFQVKTDDKPDDDRLHTGGSVTTTSKCVTGVRGVAQVSEVGAPQPHRLCGGAS